MNTYTIAQYYQQSPAPAPYSYNIADTIDRILLPESLTALNQAFNITAQSDVTVANINYVDALLNAGSNSFFSLSDVPAVLVTLNTQSTVIGLVTATLPATVAQAEILLSWQKYVDLSIADTATALAGLNTQKTVAGFIQATTQATVAEAQIFDSWVKDVEYGIDDTAANLVTLNTQKTITGPVVATDAADVSQALILGSWVKDVFFLVEDTVENVVAALPDGLDALNRAQIVGATGSATAAQAAQIYTIVPVSVDADGVGVLIENISDTAANLAGLTLTGIDFADEVAATDAATVSQATAIWGFLDSGNAYNVSYSITDAASLVAASTAEILGAATNIEATGASIDVASAQFILDAVNSGTTSIASVADTAANAATLLIITPAQHIDFLGVTDAADVAQATTISGFLGNGVTAALYDIADTAANVAGADVNVLDNAEDIAATGTATAAQANTIMSAVNSGETTVSEVSDTSANVVGLSVDANDTITKIVTTDTSNASQATAIALLAQQADTTTLEIENITDGFVNIQNMANSAAGLSALASVQTATVANGTSAADLIQFGGFSPIEVPQGLVIDGRQGNDSITGSEGVDNITGGAGADTIGLLIAGGADTVVQGSTASVAATVPGWAGLSGGGALQVGSNITFGNGVDVVNDFLGGLAGDILSINIAGRPQLALGLTAATAFTNNTTAYYLSGNYSSLTGVFTVAADGAGADTMIAQTVTGANFNTSTSYVVLRGTDSDTLLASNFTGATPPALSAALSTGPNNNSVLTFTGSATGVVSTTAGAALTITQGGTALPVTGGAYAAADLTTITAETSPNNGFGFGFNLDFASTAILSGVTGSQANDTFTYAGSTHAGFGAAASVTGGQGVDTLQFTAAVGNNAQFSTGANAGADNFSITSIENLRFNGGLAGAASLLDNVTTSVAVTNATGAATFTLGNGASHSYSAVGVNGVQTITARYSADSANTSVTTGISDDTVTLFSGAGTATWLGALNGGLGTNALVADVNVVNGISDITGAPLSNFSSFTLTNSSGGGNVTAVLNEANVALFTTISGTAGGGSESLTLSRFGDGIFNLTTKAVTGFTGGALTLVGADTVIADQADTASFAAITGDATVGVTNVLSYTTTDLNTVVLSGKTVSNIDTVIIAGSDRTLSIDSNEITATNYTSLTGQAGNNNLTILVAGNTDMTNATVSGFDAVDATAILNNDLRIDGQTFVGNVTIAAAAGANLIVQGSATTSVATDLTNLSLAAGTNFNLLSLQKADTALATHTVTTLSGLFTNAGYTNIDSFIIGAGAGVDPSLIINMDTSSLSLRGVTNIGAVGDVDTTINGTAGSNVISFQVTKAAGSSMEVNTGLGNDILQGQVGSGNVFTSGQVNLDVANAISVNDFNTANDTYSVLTTDLINVGISAGAVATNALNVNTNGYAYINTTTVSNFSNIGQLGAAVGTITGAGAGDVFYVAVSNTTNTQVGIYSVLSDGSNTITAADDVALVAVLDTTGSFGVSNMGFYA